ncbi:hypothetical protein JCGZ_09767 [Jatropha curcas]|uniref:Response regulatory domain-containing protein n=1 Tax=Jatropha curcas TaxID=180498 RepID=A0A067KJQ2_JATCU|nr:hypothetical protein JCGZ_09767 [Jatropha curcas]
MHRAGLRHILFFVIPVPQVLSLQSRLQEQVGENTGARIHEILEQLKRRKEWEMMTGNSICSSERSSTASNEFDGNRTNFNNDKDTNSNFTVLLVDADSIMRAIHKLMLTEHGMEVVGMRIQIDAHKAIHKLSMEKKLLTFIVLATKELRDMGVYSAIVGVVSRNEEAENFMEAGLDGCVSKPLSIEKLAPFLPFPSTASTGESDDDYDGDDRQSSTSSNGN